ncbi:hypothetical protein C5F50_06985 [Nitrosopumilus ureiphilus]|uniref:Uncharacterized protein n=1 Tax=Nitrosopumilus ureiphilus TaxID=1470067 RepID=A0A7D5MA53_9ARCH|nr:hypothetical protein C5F50_06985 [Nitrosopumilus ureiphilus]
MITVTKIDKNQTRRMLMVKTNLLLSLLENKTDRIILSLLKKHSYPKEDFDSKNNSFKYTSKQTIKKT